MDLGRKGRRKDENKKVSAPQVSENGAKIDPKGSQNEAKTDKKSEQSLQGDLGPHLAWGPRSP